MLQKLKEFRDKVDVPAVYGGVVNASGDFEFDCIGVRRRGYQETVASGDQIHIGSCCKMLTACLFGTFVAEQRVKWDMPVTDLFPDLASSIAPGWQDRTVEELFYCISGMMANPPRKYLRSGYTDTRPLPQQRTEMTELAFSQPPRKPGRFLYSNMSYMVMGAAIDRLSGNSYERALESRLLAPLGITSAGFGPPPVIWGHGPKIFFAGMALFKGKSADPTEIKSDNPPMLSSAGTLHLAFEDWAKLVRLFQVESNLGVVDDHIIERIFQLPQQEKAYMTMGWGPIHTDGLSFGAQGSNVRWAATVLMDAARQRIALVVCNDGRSSVLKHSVPLARQLLGL